MATATTQPAAVMQRHLAVLNGLVVLPVLSPAPRYARTIQLSNEAIELIDHVQAIADVLEAARLVSQWSASTGSGPIEELLAEVVDLRAKVEAAGLA